MYSINHLLWEEDGQDKVYLQYYVSFICNINSFVVVSGSAELVIQRRIVIHKRIVYTFIDKLNGVIWVQFGSFWQKLL